MEGPIPGAEFYGERLARAQAVPKAQRSSDTKAWLALHAELEAATALLPPLPASATAQRPLLEPLGGDVALAGLLQYMAGSFGSPHLNPLHPRGTLRCLAPQLPPLMRVWAAGRNQVLIGAEPELVETLCRGGLEADDADLEVLARLLLVAVVTGYPEIQQFQVGLDVLGAIQRPLFASDASLDRQLARLQQKCSGSGGSNSGGNEPAAGAAGAAAAGGEGGAGGGEGKLPTAAQLQAAWAGLAIEMAQQAGARGLPQARVAAFVEKGARQLVRLQPGSPRGSYGMGMAAVINATAAGGAPGLRDPLPHFLRAAELARQQGSDFWLARSGWLAAMVAASDSNPALSPAAAAALLAEADAAYARCKPLCPPWWNRSMKADKEMTAGVRPIISQHAQRSPASWQAAIRREQLLAQQRRADKVLAKHEAGLPVCDTCGLPPAELKWCPCRTAKYCSTDCQKRDFKAHRLVCTAVKDKQRK